MLVRKRDGRTEAAQVAKLEQRLSALCEGLDLAFVDTAALAQRVLAGFCSGITADEVETLAAETCAYTSQRHPDLSVLAARIVVSGLHRRTSDSFVETLRALRENLDGQGRPAPLIADDVWGFAQEHAEELESAIDYAADFSYDYFGIRTLEKSYLLRVGGRVIERPQHMLMRCACGIHCGDVTAAVSTYKLMARKKFTHATPTLLNAGMREPQMSSCFLLSLQSDSIEGIYDALKRCAAISKQAGGIGLSISDIRAKGSYIRGSHGYSKGIVPMLRVFNETARYCDHGVGRRKGAFAIYIEPWHADIFDFLDLKRNHGVADQRARDLFYALWVPDLFMQRVRDDKAWTLFCPNEACDEKPLSDMWGEEFDRAYCRMEDAGLGRQAVRARELWQRILDSQMETGTPYMLYKDHANRRSNQQHLGTIRGSNLCAEIIEYTSADEVAVCNLASLSLPAFVAPDRASFDFEELRQVTRVVARNLNRVIDRSHYVFEEARRSNERHRPVGIGVQGLADVFLLLRLPFEGEAARRLNEDIFETLYFAACEASCELAARDGPHPSYEGSPASRGMLQFDLAGRTPRSGRWDWAALKAAIAEHGLRNSLLVALMPTASTAQILGNNESFEPYTQNLYVRRVLSGDFVQVNRHLVRELVERKLWTEHLRKQLIAHNGSVQNLDLPADIKALYKTVWEIKQRSVLDLAADRGAYVDQSQSLNIHMADVTTAKLSSMHFYGWQLGLKTGMYYLRTRPATDAIKFTVDVETARGGAVAAADGSGSCGDATAAASGCANCGS